jgi:hypothetical protein
MEHFRLEQNVFVYDCHDTSLTFAYLRAIATFNIFLADMLYIHKIASYLFHVESSCQVSWRTFITLHDAYPLTLTWDEIHVS